MTAQEIIKEVKKLSVYEKITIIRQISQMLLDELKAENGEQIPTNAKEKLNAKKLSRDDSVEQLRDLNLLSSNFSYS